MITLTSVTFSPSGIAALALSVNVDARTYSRVEELAVASLPQSAGEVIAAGLRWLAAQLGEGYAWEQVVLRKIPANPADAEDEDSPPPTATLVAAVYGSHPAYGHSVIPQGAIALPEELAAGLLAVWDTVEVQYV